MQKIKLNFDGDMMKILVSACLLGENCKYNGGNNYNPAVAEYVKGWEILPVCPEMMAGMGCPRTPIEIVDGVLMDRNGNNVDAPMRKRLQTPWKSSATKISPAPFCSPEVPPAV